MKLGLWIYNEKYKAKTMMQILLAHFSINTDLGINWSLFDNWMSSNTSGSFMKINSHHKKKKKKKKQVQENIDPWTYPAAAFLNISLKSACFKDNCLRLLKVECKKKKKKIWLIVALLYLVQIFQYIPWKYLM
jgi:hypothetical protein